MEDKEPLYLVYYVDEDDVRRPVSIVEGRDQADLACAYESHIRGGAETDFVGINFKTYEPLDCYYSVSYIATLIPHKGKNSYHINFDWFSANKVYMVKEDKFPENNQYEVSRSYGGRDSNLKIRGSFNTKQEISYATPLPQKCELVSSMINKIDGEIKIEKVNFGIYVDPREEVEIVET